jgi:mRNA-degrading endonuclease RelE of RelBE toxin-antitoxin system
MTEQPYIQVAAAPTFNRNLRKLAKKYRSIRNDGPSLNTASTSAIATGLITRRLIG